MSHTYFLVSCGRC